MAAARLLTAVGEQLRSGDRIITGSIVQVPVRRGDHVRARFGDGDGDGDGAELGLTIAS